MSKREVTIYASIATIVGIFLAFLTLRLMPMPDTLSGLAFIFAWFFWSLLIFLSLLLVGQREIPREYPREYENHHPDKYEMPEMDIASSPWMEVRKLDMVDSTLRKEQGGHPSNAILAGSLGAFTPQALLLIVPSFGSSLISPNTGEALSYLMLLTCPPAIALGFVIGGLFSRLQKNSKVSRHVVLVAYIVGLVGGLIPWALAIHYAYP